MACVLTHLTVSFTEQKFLILTKSSLSIISFRDHAFGVVPKIHHQTWDHLDFLLSSESFIILCLHLDLWSILSLVCLSLQLSVQIFCPFQKLGCLPYYGIKIFLLCSGYKSVRYMFCKYFLQVEEQFKLRCQQISEFRWGKRIQIYVVKSS